MQLNGFSQLPVMSGRTLKGAVTWESIALARHTRPDARLRDALVQPQSRREDTHLLDVIRDISNEGFMVVEDVSGRPIGVVTPADVAAAYDAFATPFSLIGDLDRLLRSVIDESMDWQDVLAVLDPSGERKLRSIDQFSFGDYLRAFENEGLWQQLGWSIDRTVFREQLEAIRTIRNDVMHFNPDPPPEGTVEMLRRTQDLDPLPRWALGGPVRSFHCDRATPRFGATTLARLRPARAQGHRHLLTGSAVLVVGAAIQALSGAVFWLIAARLDPESIVGAGGKLFTSVLFVTYLAGLGLPVALARYAADRDPDSDTTFTWAVLATIGTSLAVRHHLRRAAPRIGDRAADRREPGARPALLRGDGRRARRCR